jgi:hypothetical protein
MNMFRKTSDLGLRKGRMRRGALALSLSFTMIMASGWGAYGAGLAEDSTYQELGGDSYVAEAPPEDDVDHIAAPLLVSVKFLNDEGALVKEFELPQGSYLDASYAPDLPLSKPAAVGFISQFVGWKSFNGAPLGGPILEPLTFIAVYSETIDPNYAVAKKPSADTSERSPVKIDSEPAAEENPRSSENKPLVHNEKEDEPENRPSVDYGDSGDQSDGGSKNESVDNPPADNDHTSDDSLDTPTPAAGGDAADASAIEGASGEATGETADEITNEPAPETSAAPPNADDTGNANIAEPTAPAEAADDATDADAQDLEVQDDPASGDNQIATADAADDLTDDIQTPQDEDTATDESQIEGQAEDAVDVIEEDIVEEESADELDQDQTDGLVEFPSAGVDDKPDDSAADILQSAFDVEIRMDTAATVFPGQIITLTGVVSGVDLDEHPHRIIWDYNDGSGWTECDWDTLEHSFRLTQENFYWDWRVTVVLSAEAEG